jgi:3-oxoacyl-[acyl-carrier-protein] synthase-1
MSTPHPEGKGAKLAMTKALAAAGVNAGAIDYVNLHATATRINDHVEAKAVYEIFSDAVPCGATKGVTGHTLGAAGALETIITLLALQHQFLPGSYGLKEQDADCQCQLLKQPVFEQPIQLAMSNSFGFGGNNASVILAAGK